MATTLYLSRDAHPSTEYGDWDTFYQLMNGAGKAQHMCCALTTTRATVGWYLSTLATVAGPTNGIEHRITSSGPVLLFISPPLASSVTISGSITFNLWAYESNMSANAAINARVFRLRPSPTSPWGDITQVIKTTRTTELTTSVAAVNFSQTPGAGVAFQRGDRVMALVFLDDGGGTMASGYACYFYYSDDVAGAQGDSHITFTEDLTFEGAPAGSTLYLTDDASDDSAPAAFSQAFASDVDEWEPGNFSGYTASTNMSLAHQSADGYGANGCLELTAPGTNSNEAAICPLPGRYVGGTAYTLTFWAKRVSGTGTFQYGIGSLTIGGGQRAQPWNQSIGTSWEQKTVNWTPTDDVTDPVLWFCTYGQFACVVRLDDIAVSPAASGAAGKEMWTSRGAGAAYATATTSWLTSTPHGNGFDSATTRTVRQWISPPLQAVTLQGPVLAAIRFAANNALNYAQPILEVDVVKADGSVVRWGQARFISADGLPTTEGELDAWVQGPAYSMSDGDRIRLRVSTGDSFNRIQWFGQASTAYSLSLVYAGASGGGAGDSYVRLPFTATEYTPPAAGADPFPYVGGGYYG